MLRHLLCKVTSPHILCPIYIPPTAHCDRSRSVPGGAFWFNNFKRGRTSTFTLLVWLLCSIGAPKGGKSSIPKGLFAWKTCMLTWLALQNAICWAEPSPQNLLKPIGKTWFAVVELYGWTKWSQPCLTFVKCTIFSLFMRSATTDKEGEVFLKRFQRFLLGVIDDCFRVEIFPGSGRELIRSKKFG